MKPKPTINRPMANRVMGRAKVCPCRALGSSSRYKVPPAAPYRKAMPKSRKPLAKEPRIRYFKEASLERASSRNRPART